MPRAAKPRWSERHRRWYANVGERDEGGRAREVFAPVGLGPGDEARAWGWLHEWQQARAATVLEPGQITVEDLVELYLAWCEERVAAGELVAAHYVSKQHHLTRLVEQLGGRVASTVEPDQVEAMLATIRKRYSPHYVANIAASTMACFRWGTKCKHLERNPVDGFTSPTLPQSPERFGTRAEAAAFLLHWWRDTEARPGDGRRWGRLAVLLQRCLIRTGARPGELCCLRWEDLQWDARRNRAGQSFALAKIPPDRWKAGRKTGRYRTIYFTPSLTRALRREHDRPDRHPVYVFTHGRGRGGRGLGQPWESGSRLSQAVKKARRRAIASRSEAEALARSRRKLTPLQRRLLSVEIRDEGPQRLTNYRWRHTAASTLLMLGLDAATVAALLGTSAEMILRVYGHLLDDHLTKAAEQLARPTRARRGA